GAAASRASRGVGRTPRPPPWRPGTRNRRRPARALSRSGLRGSARREDREPSRRVPARPRPQWRAPERKAPQARSRAAPRRCARGGRPGFPGVSGCVVPYGDLLEGGSLSDSDLACLSKLEQRKEGDRLLDSRECLDLLVEDEAAAAAEHRAEAFEKERDRREGQRDVAERRRGRFRRESPQRGGQRLGLLRSERTLGHWRERSRAEAEEAVGLGVEPFPEPARGAAEAPVLGKKLGELARGVVGVEVLEWHLVLLREEPARFQLQERCNQDEELAVHLEILAALLQEREDNLDDLDIRELELLLEDERE